jgi:GNAT acetyltransferase-like protein
MVRRSLKEMGRNAPVRLDHARSWDAIRLILPQFIESHVARFLATGRISNLVRPERRLFLEELAKLLFVPGWIALTRLMAGDDVFAWNYGFQFQGMWFWYQPTFDSDLEKLSPGFCLLTKLIEDAVENPDVNTVDLGLGAEEYKDRFANQNRETLYLTLTASATQHAGGILRYRAAQIVKSQARLEAAARSAVEGVGELRQSAKGAGIVGGLRLMAKRLGAFLWSDRRVVFLEWSGAVVRESDASRLQPIDLKQLAAAAMQYFDEQATLEYLLRCAVRLRKKAAEGFALSNSDGSFLCFVWVAALDGSSIPELNVRVEAPSADSVILDCWTPVSARGRGYDERTIRLVANQLLEKGKRVWTCCAENELTSVRELENAGFQKRYSLLVRQVLGRQKIKGKTPVAMPVPATEVPSRVS